MHDQPWSAVYENVRTALHDVPPATITPKWSLPVIDAEEQPLIPGAELAGTKSLACPLDAPPDPPIHVSVMLAFPRTVVLEPAPMAALPTTFSFVSPSCLA